MRCRSQKKHRKTREKMFLLFIRGTGTQSSGGEIMNPGDLICARL